MPPLTNNSASESREITNKPMRSHVLEKRKKVESAPTDDHCRRVGVIKNRGERPGK